MTVHPDPLISNYIAEHTTELISTLQGLVRIPTVNPPGLNYKGIVDFLEERLLDLGLEVEVFTVSEEDRKAKLDAESVNHPRYNILAKWNVGASKTLHMNAHYDVVPVSGEWKFEDPFSAKVEGGFIYGRGTADMKGSIACLLLALEALKKYRKQPVMNLEISFTADEETGGILGADWIAQHGRLRSDYVVVMEGGSRNQPACGHNGVIWLEVQIYGKSAHGSNPQNGINAFEKMAQLALSLHAYKQQIAKRSFTTPGGTTMHPTINVGGVITGGDGGKVNTVPAFASFTIDRRVLVNETIEEVEQELRTFLEDQAADIPDCKMSIRKFLTIYPCFTNPKNVLIQDMLKSLKAFGYESIKVGVSSGFNDSGHFARRLNVPVMGYGPKGEKLHAVDEKTEISNLIQCSQIYAHFLTTFRGE